MKKTGTAIRYIYEIRTKHCSNNGKQIYGKLYLPKRRGKLPLVLYSHGLGDNYTDGVGYAEYLAERGIAVYVFDFCGGGEDSRSDGETTEMSIMTEVSDLEAVLNIARTWSFINKRKITLLGSSQGGAVSAITAARNAKKLKGLILIYPGFVMGDDMHQRFSTLENVPETFDMMGWLLLGRKYVEDIWDYDFYRELKSYKKPVLIIHGDADGIVPLSYSKKAQRVYPNADLYVIPGAGHGFLGSEDKEAKRQIYLYLRKFRLC